jgi:hypothetical protein
MTIDTYGHLMDGDDEKAAQTTQEMYGNARKRRKGERRPHEADICATFARSQFQLQIRTRPKSANSFIFWR